MGKLVGAVVVGSARSRICAAFVVLVCALLGLSWPGGAGAVFPGPNGLIAFDAPGAGGQVGVWTVSADGSGAKEVTSEPNATDAEPTFSPDGRRIAFVNGSGHIAVMDADGQNVKDLTPSDPPGGTVDEYPAWSPDGTKLFFSRVDYNSASPRYDIWVMDASDGSGQKDLTPHTGVDSRDPVVAPDGSKVAFVRGNPNEIWTMGLDGSNPAALTHTSSDSSDPSWAPDSSKLVFSSDGTDLWLINANGSGLKQLTNTSAVWEAASSWAPDGTKIVTRGQNSSTGVNNLYLVDPTTGNETRIPNTTGADHPDWQAASNQPSLSVSKVGADWPHAVQLSNGQVVGQAQLNGNPGTIVSSPSGIDCGAGCSASFEANSTVKLTVTTVNRGFAFVGWSGGGCSGTGTCTVALSSDKTVKAQFTQARYGGDCTAPRHVQEGPGWLLQIDGRNLGPVHSVADHRAGKHRAIDHPRARPSAVVPGSGHGGSGRQPPTPGTWTGPGTLTLKVMCGGFPDWQLDEWKYGRSIDQVVSFGANENHYRKGSRHNLTLAYIDKKGNEVYRVNYLSAALKSEGRAGCRPDAGYHGSPLNCVTYALTYRKRERAKPPVRRGRTH